MLEPGDQQEQRRHSDRERRQVNPRVGRTPEFLYVGLDALADLPQHSSSDHRTQKEHAFILGPDSESSRHTRYDEQAVTRRVSFISAATMKMQQRHRGQKEE